MEILRFDESDAPRSGGRKTSVGWIVTGIIAVTLGLGTAFASTSIQINGNNPISLGEGVAATATCDSDVSITPSEELTTAPTPTPTPIFNMTTLTLGDVDTTAFDSSTGHGCGGKVFKIDFYTTSAGTLSHISCGDFDSGSLAFTLSNNTGTPPHTILCTDKSLFVTVPTVTESSNKISISGLKLNPGIHPLDYITLVSQDTVS